MLKAELWGQLVESAGLGGSLTAYAELTGSIGSGVEKVNVSKTLQAETRHELPITGESDAVYFVVEENAVYRWDAANLKYFCCGRDYSEIEVINGGDLDGK